MKKALVIIGPTATGKTDLALFLAKRFNGELVSCDSRQVYVGLDIGTGKLPSRRWKVEDGRWKKKKGFWEIEGIKIWMYDVVDSKTQYTVADYVKDAGRVIENIRKRGKLPIIVGGTGLYLKALLYGLSNLVVTTDKSLRKKLEKLSREDLQIKLQKISPEKWESLNYSDRQNPRRLVRAIELEISPRRSPSGHLRGGLAAYEVLKIGLTASREILYQKVDERVIDRINQGMIEEAKILHKEGLTYKRMRQLGLEYGILADYLEGKIDSLDELIKIIQGKIHGFVRRQLTWFKKEKGVVWADISDKHSVNKIEKLVVKWYDNHV